MQITKLLTAVLTTLLFFSCQHQELTSPEALPNSSAESTLGRLRALSEWGYAESDGPSQWCFLSPDFELCCESRQDATQSPIDIATASTVVEKLPRFTFDYRRTSVEVLHNGHTIQANVPAGTGTIWIGEKAYNLLQFHFHTPSEHTVNGQKFPIEAHLVHRADDGEIAVVGVFIVEGRKHGKLDEIWEELPQEEGETQAIEEFELRSVLPNGDHWRRRNYRYDGSFTTPPCTESINWLVFAQPREMSAEQIHAFQALFSGEEFPDGNRRNVQPVNNRPVHADQWTFRAGDDTVHDNYAVE